MPTVKNTKAKQTRQAAEPAPLPAGYQGPAFVLGDGRIVFVSASPENPDSYGPCTLDKGKICRVVHDALIFRGSFWSAVADLTDFGETHKLKRVQ